MKKALTFLLSLSFSATFALADFNITGINLGISISELQSHLRSEKAVFIEFSDSKVIARKYALGGPTSSHPKLPNEYTELQPSTEITAELCDKKVYKISFKSVYKEDLYSTLLARKEIYQYLKSNKAGLNDILFNKREGSTDVFERFIIDRDAMGGSARGKEEVTFGLYTSDFNRLGIRYDVTNKWFCPN